ncbi:hypothetical protein VLF92_13975 [Pseudomonas chengduensis]
MKAQLTLATLALSLITTHVFAAPSSAPFPLVGEAKDSQVQQQPIAPLAEDGSDRTPGAQRIQLAEDGSDRTPGAQRIQLAEGGYERTPGAQRVQLAEGGSDRLIEQRDHTA